MTYFYVEEYVCNKFMTIKVMIAEIQVVAKNMNIAEFFCYSAFYKHWNAFILLLLFIYGDG